MELSSNKIELLTSQELRALENLFGSIVATQYPQGIEIGDIEKQFIPRGLRAEMESRAESMSADDMKLEILGAIDNLTSADAVEEIKAIVSGPLVGYDVTLQNQSWNHPNRPVGGDADHDSIRYAIRP